MKSFQKNNYDKELADIKKNLVEFKKDSKELTSKKKELISDKKKYDKKIIDFTKELRKVDETADSLDELQERKVNLTNSLNKVDERVGEIATLSEQYSVEETELNEKIKIIESFSRDTSLSLSQRKSLNQSI